MFMDTAIDTKEIEMLLEAEKWEEARTLLDSYMSRPLTDKEKGEIYTNFAEVYLRVQNDLNKRYEEVLDDAIATAKDINHAEEDFKKNQIRRDLSA
ncbi:MAG TPA: hypothetical protein VJJ24_01455 [Candidatus Paceibacterota bacterium]